MNDVLLGPTLYAKFISVFRYCGDTRVGLIKLGGTVLYVEGKIYNDPL